MAVTAEELQVLISAKDQASDVLSGIGGSADTLGKKLLNMGNNAKLGMSTMNMAIVAGAAGAAVGIAYAVYEAAQFEKEMQVVSAVSGVTGSELQALGKDAMDMGAKWGVSATEMAKSLAVLGRAGITAGEQMQVLEAALEMNALEDMPVEVASEALVNITKMYGDSVENVSKYEDALVHGSQISTASISGLMESMKFAGGMAKTLGWSIEDVVAALATLNEQGLDPAMAGTTFRAFENLWTQDPELKRRMRGGLKDIGLEFENFLTASGQAKTPLEGITILYEAMSKTYGDVSSNGVEWAQALNKIFMGQQGSNIVKLMTGMEKGEGIFGKYTKDMQESYDATESAEVAMDSLTHSLDSAWVSFQNIAIQVGTQFLPVVRLLADGLRYTTTFLSEHEIAAKALAVVLGGLVLAGAAVVAMWASQYVMAGVGLLVQGLSSGYAFLTTAIELASAALFGQETQLVAHAFATNGASVATQRFSQSQVMAARATMAMGGVLAAAVIAYQITAWWVGEVEKKIKEYKDAFDEAKGSVDGLIQRKIDLNKKLTDGSVKEGTKQWIDYKNQLDDVNASLDVQIKKMGDAQKGIQKERGKEADVGRSLMGVLGNTVYASGIAEKGYTVAPQILGKGGSGADAEQAMQWEKYYIAFESWKTDTEKYYNDLRLKNKDLTLTKEQQMQHDADMQFINDKEQAYYKAIGLTAEEAASYGKLRDSVIKSHPDEYWLKTQKSVLTTRDRIDQLKKLLEETTDPNKKHLIQIEIQKTEKQLGEEQVESRKAAWASAESLAWKPQYQFGVKDGLGGLVANPLTAAATGFGGKENIMTSRGFRILEKYDKQYAELEKNREGLGEKEYKRRKKDLDNAKATEMGDLYTPEQAQSVQDLFTKNKRLKEAMGTLGKAVGDLFGALARLLSKIFPSKKGQDDLGKSTADATEKADDFTTAVNNMADFLIVVADIAIAAADAIQKVTDTINFAVDHWNGLKSAIGDFVSYAAAVIAWLSNPLSGPFPTYTVTNPDGTKTPQGPSPTATTATPEKQEKSWSDKAYEKGKEWRLWSPLTIKDKGSGSLPGGNSSIVFPQLDPDNFKKLTEAAGGGGGKTEIHITIEEINAYGSKGDAVPIAQSIKDEIVSIVEGQVV